MEAHPLVMVIVSVVMVLTMGSNLQSNVVIFANVSRLREYVIVHLHPHQVTAPVVRRAQTRILTEHCPCVVGAFMLTRPAHGRRVALQAVSRHPVAAAPYRVQAALQAYRPQIQILNHQQTAGPAEIVTTHVVW
jgi:hypothetical protein